MLIQFQEPDTWFVIKSESLNHLLNRFVQKCWFIQEQDTWFVIKSESWTHYSLVRNADSIQEQDHIICH